MKKWSFMILIFSVLVAYTQPIYKTLNGRIAFASVKGMVMLEAFSENLYLKFEPQTKNISLKVQVTSFNFTNCSKVVEKTFNDIYMESHKHHWAKFEGKLVDGLDIKTIGKKEVEAEGNLFIHGVSQFRKIKGTVTITEDNSLIFNAKFSVALADHKIIMLTEDIDRLASIIEVNVNAEGK